MDTQEWCREGAESIAEAFTAELEALASVQRLTDALAADHGATNPVAAPHTWIRPWDAMVALADIDVASRVPDPFEGRRPQVVSRRSRKGRSTYDVRRTGRAYLVGPDPIRDEQIDATGREILYRIDGRTLADLADAWARSVGAEVEPLLGLEAGRQYEQIVRTDGEDADAGLLAVQRTDLGGGLVDLRDVVVTTATRADHKYRPAHSPGLGNTLADAIDHRAGGFVRRTKTFPARTRLRSPRPRQNDPAGTATTLVSFADRVAVRRTIDDASRPGRKRTVVATAPPERVFIGHECVDRPAPARPRGKADQARRDAQKRERANLYRYAATTSALGAALVEACQNATGERQTITVGATTVTFTYRPGARVRYNWTRGEDSGVVFGRTPESAAMRFVTLGA